MIKKPKNGFTGEILRNAFEGTKRGIPNYIKWSKCNIKIDVDTGENDRNQQMKGRNIKKPIRYAVPTLKQDK